MLLIVGCCVLVDGHQCFVGDEIQAAGAAAAAPATRVYTCIGVARCHGGVDEQGVGLVLWAGFECLVQLMQVIS